MSKILAEITDKKCKNCLFMVKGYYCEKLKKTFSKRQMGRCAIPCLGKYFKHCATKNPLTIYIVDSDGSIIGLDEFKGE